MISDICLVECDATAGGTGIGMGGAEEHMIREKIRMTINMEDSGQVGKTLQTVFEYMAADPGCSRSSLKLDMEEGLKLSITSEWTNKIGHQKYLNSDAFFVLMILLDVSVHSPRIEYEIVEEVHGLDYISKLRLNDESPM